MIHNGFTITGDDGRWLLSHEEGSHWFEKIVDGHVVESAYAAYRRNAAGRPVLEMHNDGHLRQFAYDEWGNCIASWRPQWNGRTSGIVFDHDYWRGADGSVSSERTTSRNYSDYWNWLAGIPTEFTVREYVEPKKKKQIQFTYPDCITDYDVRLAPTAAQIARFVSPYSGSAGYYVPTPPPPPYSCCDLTEPL